ncbi:LysR family transcriptional regulator [Mesorhizobium sp. L-8-10]|uniref:LysR family transcriptional regulator n=1 Tax=unclassified Mesorhizobium TaxID=325217 RepID=UPI0019282F65|nr:MULTISPECIES: LysR family transcriptional regulator [unclassified Mesorhizobium]BCH24991.1 LysR family transcriptional regulator [Mesorhizobium sp. L-8-3]BCH32769.1 LysR family transcriptional regulator [Mesorhizobium sp. L-8-10]
MLDLRAITYFVATYEEGSITAASTRCHIAQPSITNALQSLEGRLGCRLFERNRRGCTPTPEGERLYRRSVDLLAHARAIEREINSANDHTILKLHLQPDIILAAVRPLLDFLCRRRPGLRISFCASEGEADMSIVAIGVGQSRRGFNELWREDYVLAVPASHPLRFSKEIGLDAFDGLDLIDRPHCIRYRWFRDSLTAAGAEPAIVAQANSEETVLALLQMGLGAAILPERHLPTNIADMAVIRFAPEIAQFRIVGVVFNGKTVSNILRLTVEELRASVV